MPNTHHAAEDVAVATADSVTLVPLVEATVAPAGMPVPYAGIPATRWAASAAGTVTTAESSVVAA